MLEYWNGRKVYPLATAVFDVDKLFIKEAYATKNVSFKIADTCWCLDKNGDCDVYDLSTSCICYPKTLSLKVNRNKVLTHNYQAMVNKLDLLLKKLWHRKKES